MHHRSVQNSGVSGVLAAASTGLHAVAVAALLVAGAAIFARAFLGAAPLTPNGALDHGIDEINSVVACPAAPPKYDRLVLVVVDALMSKVAFPESHNGSVPMPSFQAFRETGCSVDVVGVAHTPTATAPRLRALTTGVVPRFVEVIANVFGDPAGSSDDSEDSLIGLLRHAGKRMLLLGDDTWARMYPDEGTWLNRSDLVSSFFTRDVDGVDFNVSRHLDTTLDPSFQSDHARGASKAAAARVALFDTLRCRAPDWDVAVLHYLGVDHAGHTYGPRHPIMQRKLYDADGAIRRIREGVFAQDRARCGATTDRPCSTLLAVVSDHGMTPTGQHGGASDDEVNAVLWFSASDLPCSAEGHAEEASRLERVFQVDVVPSLSILLGLPIPGKNTGKPIVPLLRRVMSDAELATAMRRSADQMIALLSSASQTDSALVSKWRAAAVQYEDSMGQSGSGSGVLQCATQMEQEGVPLDTESLQGLVETYSRLLQELQAPLLASADTYNVSRLWFGAIMALVASGLAFGAVWIRNSERSSESRSAPFDRWQLWQVVCVFGIVLQPLSLSSSSAVENEPILWFWLLGGTLAARALVAWATRDYSGVLRSVAALAILRVLRKGNRIINWVRLNAAAGGDDADEPQVPDTTGLASVCAGEGSGIAGDDFLASVSNWVLQEGWHGVAFILVGCCAAGLLMIGTNAPAASARAPGLRERVVVWLPPLCVLGATGAAVMHHALSVAAGKPDVVLPARMAFLLTAVSAALTARRMWFVPKGEEALRRPALAVVGCFLSWLMVISRPCRAPTLLTLGILALVVGEGAVDDGPLGAVVMMWVGRAGFGALGGSHLITTLEFGGAYAGLSQHVLVVVALQTAVLTLAPYAIAALPVVGRESIASRGGALDVLSAALCVGGTAAWAFGAFGLILTAMRHHLMIFTVFAPRFLIMGVEAGLAALVLAAAGLRAAVSDATKKWEEEARALA